MKYVIAALLLAFTAQALPSNPPPEPVTATTGPSTWFVALNGTDGNDCRFPNKPCKTVQSVLDRLPKHIRHSTQIFLSAGVTFDGFILAGFDVEIGQSGSPYLQIIGQLASASLATGPTTCTVTNAANSTAIQIVHNSVDCAGAGWTVNDLRAKLVEVVDGTGKGQIRAIAENVANTITIAGFWTTGLDTTSKIAIRTHATIITGVLPLPGTVAQGPTANYASVIVADMSRKTGTSGVLGRNGPSQISIERIGFNPSVPSARSIADFSNGTFLVRDCGFYSTGTGNGVNIRNSDVWFVGNVAPNVNNATFIAMGASTTEYHFGGILNSVENVTVCTNACNYILAASGYFKSTRDYIRGHAKGGSNSFLIHVGSLSDTVFQGTRMSNCTHGVRGDGSTADATTGQIRLDGVEIVDCSVAVHAKGNGMYVSLSGVPTTFTNDDYIFSALDGATIQGEDSNFTITGTVIADVIVEGFNSTPGKTMAWADILNLEFPRCVSSLSTGSKVCEKDRGLGEPNSVYTYGPALVMAKPATLKTCGAATTPEGSIVRMLGSSLEGYTKLCFCVSDGAAVPAFKWCALKFTATLGSIDCTGGTTTTCP